LVIYISKHLEIRPTVLLIALAFGVTVGSVMTPIGNPQNLLIALRSGISLPFVTFMEFLAIPTLINLFLTFFILKIYFKKDLLHANVTMNSKMLEGHVLENPRLAKLSVIVLVATIAGFFVSEILPFVHLAEVPISLVAMTGAAVLYAASSQRREIVKKVDYTVLVFFVAMFVVTAALWDSGAISLFMKYLPTPNPNDVLQSNALISLYSVTLGQILSNVPFVNLYNYIMIANGFTGAHIVPWMMLAASSTIAGNLTILGAASTVIIIQAAESRGVRAFTFLEFFKIGSVVTVVNLAVYYMFLAIF
ncbi:MAG TPA: SLC13 family permease, partial [Candidatus Nitrosotalea sp.]|nr:SLC13 family permease [Candidatus Nitrosotalea sp.]